MLSKHCVVEIHVEDIGNGKWAIHGMEKGKLGEIEGFYDRMSAERHISITMNEAYPDTEIIIVDRMPYKREHSTSDLMKAPSIKR